MKKTGAIVGFVIGVVGASVGLVGTVYYGIKCFKKH